MHSIYRNWRSAMTAACAGLAFMPALAQATAPSISATEARALAKEAYIYGYSPVDHYRIQHSYFVERGGPEYKGHWNEIHNTARVYTPDDKAIQTPNSDTPYSTLGADLRREPLVLSMPAVDSKRYYTAQFIDLFTYNFDYVGSRATGNAAGNYLLAGPDWSGPVPKGINKVIRSETQFAFVFYRTQLLNPNDIDNVKKVQSGYRVQPLSSYLGTTAPAPVPEVRFVKPLTREEVRTSLEFFNVLNFVLQFAPTHPSEVALRERLAKLGVAPGRKIDFSTMSPELKSAMQAGMKDAWDDFAKLGVRVNAGEVTSADITGSREYLGANYLYRMRATETGIYGNSKEEAIYPVYYTDSTGQRLTGAQRYTIKFPADQLPPANAFWSLTMYELPSRLLVHNPIHRYLINSPMLPDLKRDADGGITIHVQHDSPGAERESNWLPAPQGAFVVPLRLFWPRQEALDSRWTKPAMTRVNP